MHAKHLQSDCCIRVYIQTSTVQGFRGPWFIFFLKKTITVVKHQFSTLVFGTFYLVVEELAYDLKIQDLTILLAPRQVCV